MLEYADIQAACNEKRSSKIRMKFSDKERFEIEKYAAVHGATDAAKHLKKETILICNSGKVRQEN